MGHHRIRPQPQAHLARFPFRLLAQISRTSGCQGLGQKRRRFPLRPEKTRRQNRKSRHGSPRPDSSRQQPISPQQSAPPRRPQRLPHRPTPPRPPSPVLVALILERRVFASPRISSLPPGYKSAFYFLASLS